MKVELERYRVLPGKSERVDEWMRMLNRRLDECLATFDRERMYIEAIFRERVGDDDYLYWFSMRGEGGESVETSDHNLDREHLNFWRECIDPDYGGTDAQGHRRSGRPAGVQVAMVPEKIMHAIEELRRDRGGDGKMLA